MFRKKAHFVVFVFMFLSFSALAQERRGLFVQSTSFSPGIIFTESRYSDVGLNLTADLTTNYHDHLFTMFANFGNDLSLFDEGQTYFELNVMYGREFKIKNWFFIEGHAGPGLFSFTRENENNESLQKNDITLGYGLRAKFLFYLGQGKFAIGLNPNVNFNSLVNTISGGVIFQWRLSSSEEK